jgi:nucleoside 2-deoxyribosyltransferase
VKLYVSGPMTGYEDLNRPAFYAGAKTLRELGFEVVSPAEIADGETWDDCLKADIAQMVTCDAVVTLYGWQASRGARMETAVAILLGIPVVPIEEAINGNL